MGKMASSVQPAQENSPAQLPLFAPPQEHFSFENFYEPDDNPFLISLLQKLAVEADIPLFFLFGEWGSGKTHLLHACCNRAAQQKKSVIFLPLNVLNQQNRQTTGAFQGIEQYDLVALDDLHLIAGDKNWEEEIFHLINRIRDCDHALLISSEQPLATLAIQLPDLRSRLQQGVVEQIPPLADAEKWRVLQHRARLRGMKLDDAMIRFLSRRTPRDFHTLFDLLEQMDQQTLAEQRRLTIPFVKKLLSF